ncbi:MAG TPA: hypothetical protein ENH82_20525 [bacterium]|nr:hypothetical protein [bacterium]
MPIWPDLSVIMSIMVMLSTLKAIKLLFMHDILYVFRNCDYVEQVEVPYSMVTMHQHSLFG